MARPSCGIRNFNPPPASGLDLGPGGRKRSVGDEERSHSAPSNCTVGRQGQKKWVTVFTQFYDQKGLKLTARFGQTSDIRLLQNHACSWETSLGWAELEDSRSRADGLQNYQQHHNYHYQQFYESQGADKGRMLPSSLPRGSVARLCLPVDYTADY